MLLVAMLAPLAGPAEAATPRIRSLSHACPTGHVPESGFVDTAETTFAAEIECVAAYAVASGQTSASYNPGAPVTRGQLATFVANMLRASGKTRPSSLPDYFTDDAGTHEANINWVAHLGIVSGYGDRTFRPNETVTRAQLATFLNGAVKAIGGKALTTSVDYFSDDNGTTHERNINALAGAGIIGGVGGGKFNPTGTLSRGQMAAFLARSVDLFVQEGRIKPPFGAAKISVAPFTTATHTLSTSTGEHIDRGRRTYTVAVPLDVKSVNIALFPPDSLKTVSGELRFTSNTPVAKDTGVSIEEVNGVALIAAATGKGATQVNGVSPVGGNIVIVVDAVDHTAVVPVVWHDTVKPTENRLDLAVGASISTPRAPIEAYAVGGEVRWIPAEPALNVDVPAGTVRHVNASERWYTLDTGGGPEPELLVRWSTAGETFRYTASNVGTTNSVITRSQFESWLSAGDRVDPGLYKPGSTIHTITGDVPAAPTAVGAVVNAQSKVEITFTKPANPVATVSGSSYRLERAPVTGFSSGTFVEVASIAGNATAIITDTPTTSGVYAYRVVARSVTGNSPASEAREITFTVPTPATTASSITDNQIDGTGGANSLLDRGDRLTLTFDRPVTVTSTWSVDVLDKDGTVGRVSNANSSIAVSGAGSNVVTITLGLMAPQIVTIGGLPGVNIPSSTTSTSTTGFLQVINTAGIGNAAGTWNLAKSGLAATYNTSRVLRDGTGGGVITPVAPGGHLQPVVGGTTFEIGRNERVTLSATNHTTGTFKLRFDGQTTAEIAPTATAGDVLAALEALSTITAGDITVTGGPLNTTAVVVTFVGPKSATNVADMTIEENALAGGTTNLGLTILQGANVTGVAAGDKVHVFNANGVLLGSSAALTADVNFKATVSIGHTVVAGTTYYVVVEKSGVPYRSRTAPVTS